MENSHENQGDQARNVEAELAARQKERLRNERTPWTFYTMFGALAVALIAFIDGVGRDLGMVMVAALFLVVGVLLLGVTQLYRIVWRLDRSWHLSR